MSALVAVYDASVLYPAPLRDFLIHLASAGLFRARWTDAIHDEWTHSLLKNRPDLDPGRLARTRTLMNAAIRDSLITGYEDRIETLSLPDPDDRHVLAAAIHAGAAVIVTTNLTDFPATLLRLFGMRAQHPDAFALGLLLAAPAEVCRAVRTHRLALRRPRKSIEEYLNTLERQSLSRTVRKLSEYRTAL